MAAAESSGCDGIFSLPPQTPAEPSLTRRLSVSITAFVAWYRVAMSKNEGPRSLALNRWQLKQLLPAMMSRPASVEEADSLADAAAPGLSRLSSSSTSLGLISS